MIKDERREYIMLAKEVYALGFSSREREAILQSPLRNLIYYH
jgi:hypothetical protein